jgi:putative (di)nucleoside polyphosphate hydrolase
VPSLIVPFKRALYQQVLDEMLAKIPPSLRIAG